MSVIPTDMDDLLNEASKITGYTAPKPQKPAVSSKLDDLDPDFRSKIDELHQWADQNGIKLKVRETYRSPKTQDDYYAQGRTKPGSIITYAKGGQSDHQYGQAIDVDPSDGNYRKLGRKAKELGLKWGGDWKGFKDWGHIYRDDARKGRKPATVEPPVDYTDLINEADAITGFSKATPSEPAPAAEDFSQLLSEASAITGHPLSPKIDPQVEQAIAPIIEAADTPAGRVLANTTIEAAAKDAQDFLDSGQALIAESVQRQAPQVAGARPTSQQLAALNQKYAKPSNNDKKDLAPVQTWLPHGTETGIVDLGEEDVEPEGAKAKTMGALGVVEVDPSLEPEEKLRVAANKVLSEHGVTPEEVDQWIADSKEAGAPVMVGNLASTSVSIGANMLDQIRAKRREARVEEIKQTGVPQEEFDPEGTTWQKIKGLTPEEIKQENLESDPLYQEAKRNAPDDIETEYTRLKANENLKAKEGESNISNYGLGETSENIVSNVVGGAGDSANFLAGILHLINSTPRATLIGDPNNESFTDWAEKKLRSQGRQLNAPREKFAREHPDQSALQTLLGMAASATQDIPRIFAIPGHASVQFGGESLLKDVGKKGHVDTQALKSAGSAAVTALLFHGAGVLGQNAKSGLLNAVLPKRTVEALAKGSLSLSGKASAALHAYGRGVSLGTITGGTAAQHLIEGGTPDEAFKAAVQMALFDLAFNAKSDAKAMSGKLVKATGNGITKPLTIMPDGRIVELKKSPPKFDVELDVNELIKYHGKPERDLVPLAETNETKIPEPTTLAEKNVPITDEARVTSNEADEIPKSVAPKTVTHPNPAIDGKPVLAVTADNKVVIENPENKSGVSIVKDRTDPAANRTFPATLPKDVLEKARAYDRTHTIEDVTPEGFGPADAGESFYRERDEQVSLQEQRLNTSIAEGKTLLKGKMAPGKRGAIERSIASSQKKLDALQIGRKPIAPSAEDIESARPATTRESKGNAYGETNKIVTIDRAQKAREMLSKKLQASSNTASSGFPVDPEILRAGAELAAFHIEAGARKFSDFSKQMVEDAGEAIRPYLVTLYAQVHNDYKFVDMENPAELFKTGQAPKRSRVGLDIEAKTVADDLTRSFEGTAGYTPVTVKEQAKKAVDLVSTDMAKVRRIISGADPVPNDMLAAPIIDAAERYARKAGDVELLKDLANSPLVSETSRHAQELRLLAERHPNSPVKLIREVQLARESQASRRGRKPERMKQEVIEAIQKEMKKVPRSPKTFADFVETLKC